MGRRADDAGRQPGHLDRRLVEAAFAVVAEAGWEDLTLERVADRAGVSRVTLWRQGITKDTVLEALLAQLSTDYRDALWPVLTAPGDAAGRLRRAIDALCEVADLYLPLLVSSDTVFHRARANSTSPTVSFVEPFGRLLADGVTDGTLHPPAQPETGGVLLFNTVMWTYVHLRGRHHWTPEEARGLLTDLVMRGLETTRD